MPRMAAKLLVIALALAVSPLHAASVVPRVPEPEASASLEAALAALPQPIPAATFFELVNAAGGPGYAVGSAQGGTQFMVITLSISVPGDPAATQPTTSLPPGVSNLDSFFDIFIDESGASGAAGADETAGLSDFYQDLLDYGLFEQKGLSDSWALGNNLSSIAGGNVAGSTTEDLGDARDADWYQFTIDSPPAISDTLLRSADQFDTELWLYDADGTLVDTDDDGVGLYSLIGSLQPCAGDPSSRDSLCSAAGGVFSAGVGVLSGCSGSASPLCSELVDPGVVGEPGTYTVVIDGFGDAAGEDFYTLTLDDTVVGACTADPAPDECGLVSDLIGQLAGLDQACTAGGSGLCDAVGLPNDTVDDFYQLEFTEDVPLSGEVALADEPDADWFSFTIDDAASVTVETPSIDEATLDTELFLYDAADFGACVADPTTPNCSAAGQVFNGVFELAQTCSEQDSPACGLFSQLGPGVLDAGDYFVRVAFTEFFGTDDDYTLDINVGAAYDLCIPDPQAAGCLQAIEILDGLNDYNTGCNADPSPACVDGALGTPGSVYLDHVIDTIIAGDDLTDESDWYSFTIDGSAIEAGVIDLGAPDGCSEDGCGLFLGLDTIGFCSENPSDANCLAAGDLLGAVGSVASECGGSDAGICPELLGSGQYYLGVSAFPSAGDSAGDYTLNVVIDAGVVDPCYADPTTPGCGSAALLQDAFQSYLSGCDASPSPGCTIDTLLPSDAGGISSGSGASTDGPRSFSVTPGSQMGGFTITETGINTGVFQVTGQTGYTFDATSRSYAEAIFSNLPPGSILATDQYQIRYAPDGKTLLLRDDTGKAFTYPTSPNAPDNYLIPLDADISDPNFTVLTGGGTRIVIPSPFATYVDVGNDPSGVATTPDEIATTAEGGGTGLIGVVTSKGGSTGPVFDIRLLNMGKPARVEGDAIFEPLSATEADAVRNALTGLMGSVNSVFDTPGTGYCVEQDKTVPGAGELFRFANAAKSAEFSYAQKVLVGARQVEGAGLLHPDSDPGDYTHSTRQWAIWTAEKGFDKEGFTDSFLEHTREVLAANGTEWSSQIEDAVRGLIDNRWNDVKQVLDAADIPVTDDDRMAATGKGGTAGAMLGLLVAGLIAAALSLPLEREPERVA